MVVNHVILAGAQIRPRTLAIKVEYEDGKTCQGQAQVDQVE